MDLFSDEKTVLKLPDAELIYVPNFYDTDQANFYFEKLRSETVWQQDDIKVFGKTYKQPRLTALHAKNQLSYSYSNITMYPKPLTATLLKIKSDVEEETKHAFTTVLLNLYRDGNDSNGWHADNEKELGQNPIITSISFGATRNFHFKHRDIKGERYKLPLVHGSLLIMKGSMQHHWLHQIPKTKKPIAERINLTFREIKNS